MAFKLSPDPTHEAEFVGNVGDTVHLTVTGKTGNVKYVVGAYNAEPLPNPTFKIVAGIRNLVVVLHNDKENDWTGVHEQEGQKRQQLGRNFRFKSLNPPPAFSIRGVQG